MIEEKYPGNKETENKVQAKVILARCPYEMRKSENVFGMRFRNTVQTGKEPGLLRLILKKLIMRAMTGR